ncbi:hypothetical protein Q31b_09450 [Novipirellula aureliae]|uniref:Transcobalamin-like C-terminal domain-containing protein n=1 Tax=Novipirellula aureliae TaxID=2527966 RepID=A0A5C6EEY8_9BACT|nr:DUF4430 domain-containing protein [Novipirellula aureliae]TWU45769.1 hypothetical protein Q31b_09450 [Novipirellula aureliae]
MNVDRSQLYPLFCIVAVAFGGCGASNVETTVNTVDQEVSADAGSVTIIIQSERGEKEFERTEIAPGATVESVMRAVDEIPVVIEGSGMTAFVHSIDGIETGSNEGWTFKVNGDFAKQGIGSTMIVPPATLTWTYGSYNETVEADNGEEVAEGETE